LNYRNRQRIADIRRIAKIDVKDRLKAIGVTSCLMEFPGTLDPMVGVRIVETVLRDIWRPVGIRVKSEVIRSLEMEFDKVDEP
jgi:DNA-binding cell septation regulator SpoVG